MRPASTTLRTREATGAPRFGFVLDELPGVRALHEGRRPDAERAALLPLVNLQNRPSWSSADAVAYVRRQAA